MNRLRDASPFVAPAVLLTGLLVVPLAGLVWGGFTSDLSLSLRDPAVQAAVVLSLATSVLSVLVIVALGTPLAYVLARWAFPGRSLVQLIVDLPIVLPPMVAGLAMLEVFGRDGWLGRPLGVLGVTVPFTTAAVVLAQVFVAGPFYVRAARIGFAGVDPAVREAAWVDGAGEVRLFASIMAPLASRALLSGLVMAWARALGEFGATIFFAGNREGVTQTIPLAIFVGFESNLGTALALSLVLLAASAVGLLVLRLIGDGRVV